MDSNDLLADLLHKAAVHLSNAIPLVPTYIHLILSATIPIIAGANASLSRPSSAEKPEKRSKKADGLDEEDDEDEDKIQKMEGLSKRDAILLPITAGIVLTVLYFLIMTYGADTINLIMGWYFAGIGVLSVSQLINDGANMIVGILFPRYYAKKGALWEISGRERKVVARGSGATSDMSSRQPNHHPLGSKLDLWVWKLREALKQKYAVKAF